MTARTMILVALTLVAGVGIAADDPKKKPEKLDGTWLATAVEDYGQKVEADQIKDLKIVFTDNEFSAADGKVTVMKGTFTIDRDKKPQTIDLKSTSGRHEGKTLEGVIEVAGDTLKICFAAPGDKRPKDFTSTLDNSAFLLVCKREKP